MTYQEIFDDAVIDAEAYATTVGSVLSDGLRFISQARNKIQKKTQAVKIPLTIPTSSLDSSGSVALNKMITVPTRGEFYSTGSTVPCEVIFLDPDVLARSKREIAQGYGNTYMPSRLFAALEYNKITFYPFQGLSGNFVIKAIAKCPVYVRSLGDQLTGDWAGWTDTTLPALMASTNLDQEFEDATEAIVAYTAAHLVKQIPNWRKRFGSQVDEWMAVFDAVAGDIDANQPDYNLNSQAPPNYGW